MRHQGFNIIFQPPKETTSGFVIILKCRFKLNKYGTLKVVPSAYLRGLFEAYFLTRGLNMNNS